VARHQVALVTCDLVSSGGAAASWKQGLGAPARSSAAPLRDGDRVLGPLAAAPRGVPGQTGTVSTPAGVDADSHSWCQSRRRSGAHRTGTGHAAAQVESRRALVGSSPHGHRWDNGHRLAHAGLGRSQRRWRRRDAMAWVSWRPSCLERFSPGFTAHGHVKHLPAKENRGESHTSAREPL
jgi:hypothetical protein